MEGLVGLHFRFKSKKLENLYYKDKGASKYPEGVVDAFAAAVQVIEAARDTRDLYKMKGFRVEKLKGKRGKQGQKSIRLTDQFRLIFTIEETKEGSCILIVDLCDYH